MMLCYPRPVSGGHVRPIGYVTSGNGRRKGARLQCGVYGCLGACFPVHIKEVESPKGSPDFFLDFFFSYYFLI